MPELCWDFAVLYTTNHINDSSKFTGMWKYIKYIKKLSITFPVKACLYSNGHLCFACVEFSQINLYPDNVENMVSS